MIIKCPSCGNIDSVYFIDSVGETNISMENGWIDQVCDCKVCNFRFRIVADFDIKIKNVEYKEW